MKKLFLLSLFLFSSLLFAQKEKTLFWEISGNGLAKKSYLYGTMHVNDKVSYHLSDAFFKNLLGADIVSNESDPETWDDIIGLMKPAELYAPYNFYTTFYLKPLVKKELKSVFVNNNYFTSMLSGVEGVQSDFQENTVLDMFIYQTGRKYKKRIVGLESAKGSMLSIMKIKQEDAVPDERNRELLVKLMKSGNFNETLRDYYREKDIVMLDSIYKLMMSKKAFDIMITNRNIVMTKSIDSLAKTGSLFSAVGAAHLAGKAGIIQLLKNKGYTLTPIFDEISTDGQKQKKTIEDFFPNPGFEVVATTDGMLKMPLNKKIIRTQENVGSPDFTNGGAINIKRVPLNFFLDKKNESFNPKTLDSLFFENIAGEILEKNYFQEENFVGYDIKNATKNGNKQHWRFYITPLELITVSMTGSGNYTKQFEKEVFDNIKIKSFSNSWDNISPIKGGFSVNVPSFNTVYGNSEDVVANVSIQAFDATEKGYYFVTERTLNNTNFLEDSEFEQKQIHYEFYLQHDIDSTNTTFDKLKKSFTSESKIGNQKIRLKSVIYGSKYYLLGTINASDTNASKFFDSFKEEKFKYSSKLKTFTDTIAKFKIDIPEKQNETLFLDIDQDNFKSKNKFLSKSVNQIFNSQSGVTVELEFYKYHKYETIKNLDSIKTQIRKHFLHEESKVNYDDYEDEFDTYNSTSLLDGRFNSKKGFTSSKWDKLLEIEEDKYQILEESSSFDIEKNVHVFNALVSREHATQAVKYKVVFNEESKTELAALVDRNYANNDPFIESTFNSFSLTDKNATSVFDDKLDVFLEDAKSENDTLRYSAMKSIYELAIGKDDFEKITNFIDTFQFKDSETNAIESLIEKIGAVEDNRVIPYLEKKYKSETVKTTIQISILTALAGQKSKLGYKKIIELLEYDLPISDNEYDIINLFGVFEKDVQNSKELFPKIFQFYSIKEYNVPILSFCNKLFDANVINSKKLNSYKKICTTNAKLEYKRTLSWKQKNPIEEDDEVESTVVPVLEKYEDEESGSETEDLSAEAEDVVDNGIKDYTEEVETADAPVTDLINYMNLLSRFPQDEATKTLFAKIKSLNIPQLNIELLRLGIINNTLSDKEIQEALANPKNRYIVVQLLLYKSKTALLNSIEDDEIAEAAVVNFESLKQKDAISLLEKKSDVYNNKDIIYYFFEIERKVEKDELSKKTLYPIAFIVENGRINPLAYQVFSSSEINEEDDISKTYQRLITQSKNETHYRASFVKQKEEEGNYLFDEYED